ncbi:MAG TPA: hypothetical protein VM925_00585 [Labilithrix sp.]|nr:hypothetical protein [Labilithrix sp.]
MAAKKKRKSSLVENINARKKAGTSRPRSRSTISKAAYEEMSKGWPHSAAKNKAAAKRRPSKKGAAKKKAGTKKTDATKTGAKKTAAKRRPSKKED